MSIKDAFIKRKFHHTSLNFGVCGFLFYFIFFPFLASLQYMGFLGQGSDPSCSCDLSCSCSNARSLTHCVRLGIEPAFQHSHDAAHPIAPQQELLGVYF